MKSIWLVACFVLFAGVVHAAPEQELNIEWPLAYAPAKVWAALAQGELFYASGAKKETSTIEFRKGGKLDLDYGKDGKESGTFTSVVDGRSASFTWGQGTSVTVDVEPDGAGSKVKLVHAHITSDKQYKDFQGGWQDGLQGLEKYLKNN
jgi:uncharacterized protein YndB with AHSA1/START domain